MMSDPFDTGPSPEYTAAKAAFDAAIRQLNDVRDLARARGVFPRDDAACTRAIEQLDAARRDLDATPEQQYLDDIGKAEIDAADQVLAAELARRGRQVSMTSIETDFSQYATTEDALYHTGCTHRMLEPQRWSGGYPLTVVADMRKLNAGQVAQILRWIADQIDKDGMPVYNGASPFKHWRPDWWADELPDGSIRHRHFER